MNGKEEDREGISTISRISTSMMIGRGEQDAFSIAAYGIFFLFQGSINDRGGLIANNRKDSALRAERKKSVDRDAR